MVPGPGVTPTRRHGAKPHRPFCVPSMSARYLLRTMEATQTGRASQETVPESRPPPWTVAAQPGRARTQLHGTLAASPGSVHQVRRPRHPGRHVPGTEACIDDCGGTGSRTAGSYLTGARGRRRGPRRRVADSLAKSCPPHSGRCPVKTRTATSSFDRTQAGMFGQALAGQALVVPEVDHSKT